MAHRCPRCGATQGNAARQAARGRTLGRVSCWTGASSLGIAASAGLLIPLVLEDVLPGRPTGAVGAVMAVVSFVLAVVAVAAATAAGRGGGEAARWGMATAGVVVAVAFGWVVFVVLLFAGFIPFAPT